MTPHIETIARAMYAADVGDDNLCVRPNWQYYIPAATLAFTMSAEICAGVAEDFEGGSHLERADDPCAAVSGAIAAAIRALAVEG